MADRGVEAGVVSHVAKQIDPKVGAYHREAGMIGFHLAERYLERRCRS